MPITNDAKQSAERFKRYADQLIELCRKQGIKGWRAPIHLVRTYRNNSSFRSDWNAIFVQAAKLDGGKIGLGTALGILGLVLGGIGLAGAWGAIGVPLVFILIPLGLLAGSEIDQIRNNKEVAEPSLLPRENEVPDEIIYPTNDPTLADLTTMIRVLGDCYVDVPALREQFDSFKAKTEALHAKLNQAHDVINQHLESLESKCQAVETSVEDTRKRLLDFEKKSLASQQSLENNLATSQTDLRSLKTTVHRMRMALILLSIAAGLAIACVWLILR